MECAFCGTDLAQNDDIVYLVPRPDGSESDLWACWDCVNAQGVYCRRHNRVYSIVDGGGGRGRSVSTAWTPTS